VEDEVWDLDVGSASELSRGDPQRVSARHRHAPCHAPPHPLPPRVFDSNCCCRVSICTFVLVSKYFCTSKRGTCGCCVGVCVRQ
jgi:hypothetical protein